MQQDQIYVVATTKSWNIRMFHEKLKGLPGEWHLITEKNLLNEHLVQRLHPRYIFFPHWNYIVPKEILSLCECVCFHETDLPYGRGGSPIQNLIARGHRETMISALRMTEDLDAGPIYMKCPLSLEGLAEEIFIRTAQKVAQMIATIVTEQPKPAEQIGSATIFKRRKPHQSQIDPGHKNLRNVFDHIRMLDAEGYPPAFIQVGSLRFELTRPAMKTDAIIADVKITLRNLDDV